MENNGAWVHEMLSLADGTMLRLSRWQPPGPPPPDDAITMLVLPGRAAQVERYTELAGDLSNRGLHVLSMDWRGQGGSSRLLPDPMVGHAVDFDAFLDDLDAALAHWKGQVKGPLVGLGHSMGGHILMRHVAERPHPFAGIIACAPMLGINVPMPQGLAWQLTRWAVRRGRADKYALMQGPDKRQPFKGNRLTSDPRRFALMQDVMARNPAVALGGASWGWLHGALSSIRHYFEKDRLEDVTVPTLILSARADRIVRPDSHDRAARRLPNCTLVPFPVGEHELLIEADPIRADVLSAIDNFLADLSGMDKHAGSS